jgi:hypothetical protein
MKTYKKPSTEIHQIELQQMIAGTANGPAVNNDQEKKVSDPKDILGKENAISSPSLWEEEE